ncbi:MAG: mevalonate kinase [Proteobacteria bacterium]|nr:mevalonate kinase [Pseudomonadota bacterium]
MEHTSSKEPLIYTASAPGSLMLFGEHAVLYGKQALCCAVDQRITVTLKPRVDRKIQIQTLQLGAGIFDLDNLEPKAPFEFILTATQQLHEHLPSGFDLSVQADFSSTMGLGSSSAVTVATLGALSQWLGFNFSKEQLFQEAKAVILTVQGVGSGADVAAAVYGGIVAYRINPLSIQSFAVNPDISLVYSGAKVPTRTVIQIVAEKQRANPGYYESLYEQIDGCARQAVQYVKVKNWPDLGRLMTQHHDLQVSLGVSTPLLNELVLAFNQHPEIYGAKISGSGLGDCVIALGKIPENTFPANETQEQKGVKQIPVRISPTGYKNDG